MQIRRLRYHQIDFNKYDYCIEKSYNSRIYAFSWYLNIVTNKNWEALVIEDYKIVMPLPFKRVKRKFLKRMVVHPFFCQQLGVFSKETLSLVERELLNIEILKLPIYNYNFNSENTNIIDGTFTEKTNMELALNDTYETIIQEYSKNLKRNINKGIKNSLEVTTKISINDFLLMKKNNSKHSIKSNMMSILINAIIVRKHGMFYGVQKEENIIAIAFMMKSKNRLIHLFSVSNFLGKKNGAIPFLFDNIIKENANTYLIFDFEGSMIPSIAQFFKRFGAKNKPYIEINNT